MNKAQLYVITALAYFFLILGAIVGIASNNPLLDAIANVYVYIGGATCAGIYGYIKGYEKRCKEQPITAREIVAKVIPEMSHAVMGMAVVAALRDIVLDTQDVTDMNAMQLLKRKEQLNMELGKVEMRLKHLTWKPKRKAKK